MRIAEGWGLSADGSSWVNASGSKIPTTTLLPSGTRVLCLPLTADEESVAHVVRRVAAGLSVWAVDDALRQAIEGFAYDPICPKILGRTAGEAAARSALQRAETRSCALLFGDLDHFKSFNEAAGHPGGDEALRVVGEVFRRNIRSTDPLWRIGDEFCALLSNVDQQTAVRIAENIVKEVSSLVVAGIPVSVTIGVAARPAANLGELIQTADRLMLHGKEKVRGSVYAI